MAGTTTTTTTTSRKLMACSRGAAKRFSKKHLALLGALCHGDGKQRRAILRTADKQLVKCICECTLNVLQGVVKLPDSDKRRLCKHKHVLRKLINRKSTKPGNWQIKKRAIVQSGGSFLPILLAPIVGTLISKLFGGNSG